jgi:hypothetical protein
VNGDAVRSDFGTLVRLENFVNLDSQNVLLVLTEVLCESGSLTLPSDLKNVLTHLDRMRGVSIVHEKVIAGKHWCILGATRVMP